MEDESSDSNDDSTDDEPIVANDVINISSSSDDEAPAAKKISDSDSDLIIQPSDIPFENPGQEYDVSDFEMPGNKVAEGIGNDHTQSNLWNDMIYGDLDAVSTNTNTNYDVDMDYNSPEIRKTQLEDLNECILKTPELEESVANASSMEKTDVLNLGQFDVTDDQEDKTELSQIIENLVEEISVEATSPETSGLNTPNIHNEAFFDNTVAVSTSTNIETTKLEIVDGTESKNTDAQESNHENTDVNNTNVLDVAVFLDNTEQASTFDSTQAAAVDTTKAEPEKKLPEEKIEPMEEASTSITDNKITTTPIKKRIHIDDQQPSTSKAAPPKIPELNVSTDSPRRRSVRARSVDQAPAEISSPLRRSTRAKSVSTTNLSLPKTPTTRSVSTSKLDIGNASEQDLLESSASRPKTRRLSVLLESVPESPKSPRTRRKTISESSDISKAIEDTKADDVKSTPKRGRKPKDTSDTESNFSTPSRKSVDRNAGLSTPTTRSRSRQLEQESPDAHDNSSEIGAKPRRTTRASSKQPDDDTLSVSSIASSAKGRTKRKPSTQSEDDDFERSSTKSGRTKKLRTSLTNLPAIAEDEADKGAAGMEGTPNIEYSTSSRRLTRSQLAQMEKYADKRQPEAEGTPRRVTTRRSSLSAVKETPNKDDDVSDTESVGSTVSRMSGISKISKASKTSKTSKRGRPRKVVKDE